MDNYQSLCMLMLMRLKTELEPFDRVRLHKAAMFVEIFSRSNCFKISDERLTYYSVIDNLSELVRQYQHAHDADTEKALEILHSDVADRVKESYTKSIPYILQSAGFVNSIADGDILLRVSFVCGMLKHCGKATVTEIEKYFHETRNPGVSLSPKDLITTLVNLEKSGVAVKTEADYKLADNLRDVAGYVVLLY